LGSILGVWDNHFLPNSLREFIFKFYNNSLKVNSRLHHFLSVDKYCTFCKIAGGIQHEESFSHFFLECEHVRSVQDALESRLFPDPGGNSEQERRKRWCGLEQNDLTGKNIFMRIVYLTVQYLIWREKFKHRLPNMNYIAGELVYTLDQSTSISLFFNTEKNFTDCVLSRVWTRLRESRW